MSNLNNSSVLRLSIRLLLGVFFIGTAVLKLLSIDNFEIYIYSFRVFSFTWTTFFSRLLIFTELLIGISLIFKICFKHIWWLTMFLMVGFTLFLIYSAIFRNDSNCHCFGSLIELGPKQSIVKNIIVLALLVLIRNEKSYDYRPLLRKCLVAWILLISLAIPFVLLPMDVVYNRIYSEKDNVNTVAFYESLNDSTYIDYLSILSEKTDDTVVFVHQNQMMDAHNGRYLINYAIAGCKFCQLGAEKLILMLDRHQIPHDRVKFVVGGNDIAMSSFIRKTNTFDYDHWKIPAPKMMSITFGKYPLYVFLEDGKVVKAGDFRILDDEMIEKLKQVK